MAGKQRAQRRRARTGPYQSSTTEKCTLCGDEFDARGLSRHFAACEREHTRRERMAAKRRQREHDHDVSQTPKRGRHSRQTDPVPPPSTSLSHDRVIAGRDIPPPSPHNDNHGSDTLAEPDDGIAMDEGFLAQDDGEGNVASPPAASSSLEPSQPPRLPISDPPAIPATHLVSNATSAPMLDDIKVEYHRASKRPTKIYSFADFTRDEPLAEPAVSEGTSTPWTPFGSRLDFDFAELTHETHMNKGQIQRLLDIIHGVASKKDKFTFQKVDDVDLAWSKAQLLYPSFKITRYPVEYKDQQHSFDFHHRPLWPWLMSQVQDPLLAKYFRWDAQRLYKYDGTEWVRFYDEPWTAELFSKVQSKIMAIDPDGKPFAIILWADTTKLSTFGSQKGHFIIARAGNLPEFIRNGVSVGGGRIVGFVPLIPSDDPNEKGKKKYINFKNAIYHEAFREFLKDVAAHSKDGYQVKCGDSLTRTLFPYIHIISADYEEQCHVCLIRGLGGLSPCPVCLIPKGTLSDLKTKHPYRKASQAETLVLKEETKGAKEEALKPLGLRAIRNAYWDVCNTDVHLASSFDRLHAYMGLFKDHLVPELKDIVNTLDRAAAVKIEMSVRSVPRWPGLTHFNGILDVDFADGKKWDDISKIVINVAHHVLTQQSTTKGFALLRLIRKFVELNCLVSLEVHTAKTINAFERTLEAFHDRLQDYKKECEHEKDPKDWDVPIKIHSHAHAARDIVMKGVISNMDTKPNERLNGPMRKAYLLQTNFKDIERQLGKLEDRSLASCSIRARLDDIDAAIADDSEAEEPAHEFQFRNIYLGSRKVTSVSGLIQDGAADRAFHSFESRLATCVNRLRAREGKRSIRVQGTDKIVNCGYIKTSYESSVSWRAITDLLRCNPAWGNSDSQPRFDTVIVDDGESGHILCKLIRVFTYTSGEDQDSEPYALTLVQPLNAPTGNRPGDYELGLCRVREKNRDQSRILPARSIVRGALIVQDPTHATLFPQRDIVKIG